jgi:predicted kinase
MAGARYSYARAVTPPLVVVVTGPPASGKSTIARELADALAAPLIAKDPIKEALFDSLGTGDPAWSRKLGIATYGVMYLTLAEELRAGRSCVLESNFDHRGSGNRLRDLQGEYRFSALQIVCTATRDVLLDRYVSRSASRHPGHIDDERFDEVVESIDAGRWRALELDAELIEVDTTDWDNVDIGVLVRRATDAARA